MINSLVAPAVVPSSASELEPVPSTLLYFDQVLESQCLFLASSLLSWWRSCLIHQNQLLSPYRRAYLVSCRAEPSSSPSFYYRRSFVRSSSRPSIWKNWRLAHSPSWPSYGWPRCILSCSDCKEAHGTIEFWLLAWDAREVLAQVPWHQLGQSSPCSCPHSETLASCLANSRHSDPSVRLTWTSSSSIS